MAMAGLQIVFTNREAFQSLYAAMDLLIDMAKEQPWNNDAREVLELLDHAAKGLTIQRVAG